MIQVIHRAFDILELLGKEPQTPKTLAEISGSLNLNSGTCANIIKTLTDRQYIEKVGNQKGYTLGILSYKLTGDNLYKKPLIDAAKEELEKITAKINESALLGILIGDNRVSVHITEGYNDLAVRKNLIKKAYSTSTGRLLISNLSDTELEKFVDKYGLPQQAEWEDTATFEKLFDKIKTIRVDKFAIHITESQVIGLAVPVCKNSKVIASLGTYMPLFRYKNWKEGEIIAMLQEASRKIESNL